jgi:hypothetical protein
MIPLKSIFLIIVMMIWIPLYLWSQDSVRCYNREQRETIANHNIERLDCLEQLYYADSIITDYKDINNLNDSLIDKLHMSSKENKIIIDNLNNYIDINDRKIKSLKTQRAILIGTTITLLIICLL